jgi:hypothetical protein
MPKNFVEKEEATLHRQLSIFDLPCHDKNLTTGEVCQKLNISPSKLQKQCSIKQFCQINNYTILHQGHNSWELIKI